MGAQAHSHDMLQSHDASAQQSQQAPTLLLNSTNAAERWDGKSLLLRYLEPIIDGVKNVISPIANIFYGGMPTFRGLNSDVSTAKSVEAEPVEDVKKPKEFLIPQPRHIAQRKNFRKTRNRPKKHVELNIDLNKLKHNKDLHDYVKTKKYKFNYPTTFYYPRIKYVVNPNTFYIKPNNSRLIPYSRKQSVSTTTTSPTTEGYWKPIIVFNDTVSTDSSKPLIGNYTRRFFRNYFQRRPILKRRKRIKRELKYNTEPTKLNKSKDAKDESFLDFLNFGNWWLDSSSFNNFLDPATELTKGVLAETVKMEEKEPMYYSAIYDMLMTSLDVIDGIFSVEEEVHKHYFVENPKPKKKRRKSS